VGVVWCVVCLARLPVLCALALSLAGARARALSLSLSLTHTPTHSLSHTLSRCRSLSPPRGRALSLPHANTRYAVYQSARHLEFHPRLLALPIAEGMVWKSGVVLGLMVSCATAQACGQISPEIASRIPGQLSASNAHSQSCSKQDSALSSPDSAQHAFRRTVVMIAMRVCECREARPRERL